MNSEEQIGEAVAAYLRSMGWTVYAEVQVPAAGKRRADIVAVREGEVWVVECKTRLTWALIAQVEGWAGWAHYRSVATEHGPTSRAGDTQVRALFALGLTWYWLSDGQVHGGGFRIPQVAARAGILLDALRPEHTTSRPGTASGEHYTQTQERDARIRALVAERPGVELREVARALGLRLDAAGRRLLARHCRNALDGVRATPDGKRLLLWPAERTA